ncbi:MAG: molybdate ABC transporter substrate-binding protein [Gemmataceae bacterium]|nr:molybdate ABC transporter substrate-binding protein [Gemmataceae bacterium]
MLSRFSPALVFFAGSVALLAALIGTLYWTRDPGPAASTDVPLEVYCAEAMRLPLKAIAEEYEAETKQHVVLTYGASQSILTQMELAKKGDLFLPADDSYIRQAKKKNMLDDVMNVASMNAVVIVSPKCPTEIKTWDDFLAQGSKIGLANPEATAIGKITQEQLQGIGLWEGLEKRKPSYLGTVNEVGNSVANVGSSYVGIVWDAVAQPLQVKKPDMKIVKLKELENVKARVQIAVTKSSNQPANARRFVDFLRHKDKGGVHLKKHGYTNIETAEATDKRHELVVYAGSMLRPALEESLDAFEKRENVRILRNYNGCGILVSQMKAGAEPDLYFACDTSFMMQVKDQFEPSANVSTNQLMIVVKKGNPKQVLKLEDLGKKDLQVGVGHEHQCALGALTKETFIRSKVYDQVIKNVRVQSPAGDLLVNQMRVGSLDVVVAYRSNLLDKEGKPYPELEGIPINGIPCATPSQPIAVAKGSAHPDLSRRLMEFLQKEESRQRFEKLGFGWDVKEIEK